MVTAEGHSVVLAAPTVATAGHIDDLLVGTAVAHVRVVSRGAVVEAESTQLVEQARAVK